MIQAKQTSDSQYELYSIKIMTDINGNEVQVPQSIGKFSLINLETEKSGLLAAIDVIDEKINSINLLNQ